MNEFALFYRGDEPNGSPEELQQAMEKWSAWFKTLAVQGHIKDIGAPLERSGKVIKGKRKIVSDGPFAEAKDAVGGYSLILARDLVEAAELSKGCPIFESGGSVEVRPVQKLEI